MTRRYPWVPILLTILATLIMIKVINQTTVITQGFKLISNVLIPVLWGGALAFLLDPLVRTLQKRFRFPRLLSVGVTLLLFMCLVGISVVYFIPLLINGCKDLANQVPIWVNQVNEWIQALSNNDQFFNDYGLGLEEILHQNAADINQYVQNALSGLVNSSISVIMSTTSFFVRVFFMMIAAAFLLLGKETTINSMQTLIRALFNERNASLILGYASISKGIFYQFVIGKLIESTILTIVAILGFTLIGMPYAFLLSVFIGVTNVIPYIGPVTGALPPLFIAIFIGPWQLVAAMAVVAVVQIIDNAVLQPKLLGEIVGLPPIWVLISVLVGGACFGAIGMLLGIPVFACIKVIIGDYLEYRLAKKGLTGNPPMTIENNEEKET